jgi:hypothetical protein
MVDVEQHTKGNQPMKPSLDRQSDTATARPIKRAADRTWLYGVASRHFAERNSTSSSVAAASASAEATCGRRPTKTRAMADRLLFIGTSDPRIARLERKIFRCSRGIERCGQTQICPRCSRRAAKRRRRAIEQLLQQPREGARLFLLTLSIGADRIESGRRDLMSALRALRRRKVFAAMQWGRGQAEFAAWDDGPAYRWNVHAHLLVAVRGEFDSRALESEWRALVGAAELPGAVQAKPVREVTPGGGTFLRCRLLREQAPAGGFSGAQRRADRADRARSSRPPVGHPVGAIRQTKAGLSLGVIP